MPTGYNKDKNRIIDICCNPVCFKSGIEQPIDEFNWHNKTKGIRHGRCKTCSCLNPNHRINKKLKQQLLDKGFKKCSNPVCFKSEMEQPIENFPWRDKLKGTRRGICKECMADYKRTPKQKEYKANYAKSIVGKATHKKYRQSSKGRAKIFAYKQTPKYKASQALLAQSSKRKASLVAYVENNRKRVYAWCRKRQIAKLQRIPKWAELSDIEQFIVNCSPGMEVDHIIPLQGKFVSGLHVLGNLQYLTKSENRKKKNKFDPIKFNNLDKK